MAATYNYKKNVKQLFEAMEPEGRGKVHKDTLKENIQKMLLGKRFDDKEIDALIENIGPDKDGMISTNSYMKLFSMPQFSAEEAAATMRIIQKRPDLLDGLMNSKELAEKLGFDKPQEVKKVMTELKNCYLENLEDRLKKDPPKSKKEVLQKQAIIMNSILKGRGSKDMGRTKKDHSKSKKDDQMKEAALSDAAINGKGNVDIGRMRKKSR